MVVSRSLSSLAPGAKRGRGAEGPRDRCCGIDGSKGSFGGSSTFDGDGKSVMRGLVGFAANGSGLGRGLVMGKVPTQAYSSSDTEEQQNGDEPYLKKERG